MAYGQTTDFERFNNQVRFLNESIHGALIVHRVYESFNLEINKYIKSPTYSINKYRNKDLPGDVFLDDEHWFYPISPVELRAIIDQGDVSGYEKSILDQFSKVTTRLNQERKSIERYIQESDLNKVSDLAGLYERLEAIRSDYDALRSGVDSYEKYISKLMFDNALDENRKQVYTAVVEIHYDIKETIRLMSNDRQSQIIRRLTKIEKEYNWLNTCVQQLTDPQEKREMLKVKELIKSTVDYLREYLDNPNVPEAYVQYGKSYYYHNVPILTNMNRYGNGYVNEFNKLIDKHGWSAIHLIEEPHYFRAVYPNIAPRDIFIGSDKIDMTLDELRADIFVVETPDPPKKKKKDSFFMAGRGKPEEPKPAPVEPESLNIVATHTIYADSLKFNIQLYDHLIKDGDRVSINVNGRWVYNDISLEKDPKIITLNIEPTKENYIMIQAVNVGWRPPNTVGVRYRSNGKVENLMLKTDLKSTELLQIKYRKQ